jgi:hypothetical protein
MMDPLIIVLIVLLGMLAVSIRMAGAEKRRRRRASGAYFQHPETKARKKRRGR